MHAAGAGGGHRRPLRARQGAREAVGEPVGVVLADASAPVLLIAAADDCRVMTWPDIALILGAA